MLYAGGYALPADKLHVLNLWAYSLAPSVICLITSLFLAYWGLILAPFLAWALWLEHLANLLHLTGFYNLCISPLLPTSAACFSLLNNPFAIASSSAIVAYYTAVGVLWPKTTPSQQASTPVTAYAQAQSSKDFRPFLFMYARVFLASVQQV